MSPADQSHSDVDSQHSVDEAAHPPSKAISPACLARLTDENGKLRRFLNVYVKSESERFLDHPGQRPLSDGDEVSIVPAVAGAGIRQGSVGNSNLPGSRGPELVTPTVPSVERLDCHCGTHDPQTANPLPIQPLQLHGCGLRGPKAVLFDYRQVRQSGSPRADRANPMKGRLGP